MYELITRQRTDIVVPIRNIANNLKVNMYLMAIYKQKILKFRRYKLGGFFLFIFFSEYQVICMKTIGMLLEP